MLDKWIDTIQLGSCYDLIKSIPDKSIDLVYIDIPYDINYSGGGCLAKNVKHNKKMMNEHKETLMQGIDFSILDELCRCLKYIYIYIWCSKSQIKELMDYFIDKKKCNFNILCWCKDNPVPFGASHFLSDIEYCLVFYESGAKIFQNGCDYKHKWYISHINVNDKKKYNHPTIKPLEVVKNHILNSTNENDIVLDCFCGSGTTCVACKETGRRYIGMEIDKEYWKIANDRINGINANGQMSIFTDFEKVKEDKKDE